jgi:arylsulfatase
VGGVAQRPMEGVSFAAALTDPAADTGKTTQFYSMLGTRGIWSDGWFANTVHAASPAGWGHFDDDRWELFNIAADRSQCRDLAAENPAKLAELKDLWFSEADKYNGLPLGDLNVIETFTRFRPTLTAGQTTFTYYPGTAPVGLGAMVEPRGMSFSVLAEVAVDSADAEGVLFKQGAGHGGHVLFIKDRRLHYVYNFMGEDEQSVTAPDPIPLGKHVFGVRYERTGTAEGSHTPVGTASLYVDDAVVATLAAVRTHPATFGLAGASVQVGRNGGQPVCGAYRAPFDFSGGTIVKVVVDTSGTPYIDRERELALAFARD